MFVYLIISSIVMVNLLIAVLNSAYERGKTMAASVWAAKTHRWAPAYAPPVTYAFIGDGRVRAPREH